MEWHSQRFMDTIDVFDASPQLPLYLVLLDHEDKVWGKSDMDRFAQKAWTVTQSF